MSQNTAPTRLRSVSSKYIKGLCFDIYRTVEEPHISVNVRDILPVLCVVTVEVMADVALVAFGYFSERWHQCCA